MATQQHLLRQLAAAGLHDPEIDVVRAIERLRGAGDELGGVLWPWLEGECSSAQALENAEQCLDLLRDDVAFLKEMTRGT